MIRRIGKILVLMLVIAGISHFGIAQAPPPDVPANDTPATSRWPMVIATDDGQIMVFQPQLEDFQGNILKGRAAVSVTKDNQEPVYGAVWLESQVNTDRVARTVQVQDVKVTQSRFPGMDDKTTQSLGDTIARTLTADQATLSLDQLLSMLESIQKENVEATDLETNPPVILFRDHPSIKVQYDGQPRMVEVSNSPLMRVANTPFFVVFYPQSKTYFLKGAGLWFAARDSLGPWQSSSQVPPEVTSLADASDYKDPQQPVTPSKAAAIEIVTATEPTELIWTDGVNQMATIPGVGLLYVANTDSDVFVQIDTQRVFVLLSGRWYTAPNRNGPWTYVAPDKLPEDFSRIPPNSEQGDVLAHVAGTQAAQDAVADAEIPQTAAVDRSKFDQPQVQYDGQPQFQPVQDLQASYAVNSPTPVVQVENRYYCCDNAVWYLSASAYGPWDLCTSVPTVIYRLPPSCPIYPVRFCHVYGFTSDVIYVGYTPGYVGCYSYRGAVVYGTGYRYQPWWGRAYYPRPYTFGFAAHYNSYVGHWGFSFGLAAGTGGGIWIGEGNSWGRRDPWFGYGGYRPVIVHHDVHEDMFRRSYIDRVRNDRNSRNDRPVRDDVFARNVYERRQDVRQEAKPTVRPVSVPPRTIPGPTRTVNPRENVFSDRDGTVYRRTNNTWEVRDRQGWHPAPAEVQPGRSNQPGTSDRPSPPVVRTPPAPTPRPTAQPEPRPSAPPAPRQVEPAQRPEPSPRPSAPPGASKGGDNGLNGDYRAREAGNSRLRNYERPSAPPGPSQGQRGR